MSNRSFGLDFLRALAIILVLIAHFAKEYEHLGFWGVELFFALSGFLIGQILWVSFSTSEYWEFKKLVNFWERRWWRTLPNYYIFLIIMILFNVVRAVPLPPFEELQKFFWFGQNLMDRKNAFFGVSWSLCIEEWFYLIFPALLFALSFIIKNKKITFLMTFLVLVAFSFLMRQYLLSLNVGHSLRGITLARLDSIGCGVFIAFIYKNIFENDREKLKLSFVLVGAAILAACFIRVYFLNIKYEEIRQESLMLFATPFAFALILPYMSTIEPIKNIGFINSTIEKFSLWSYSMYLSHIPVMFMIYLLTDSIRDSVLGNLFSKILGLIITIAFSAFMYKYVELPLTNKRPATLK